MTLQTSTMSRMGFRTQSGVTTMVKTMQDPSLSKDLAAVAADQVAPNPKVAAVQAAAARTRTLATQATQATSLTIHPEEGVTMMLTMGRTTMALTSLWEVSGSGS